MTELDLYSVEARKHGMTYGQYVAAIRNGELLPPRIIKDSKPRRTTPSFPADANEKTYRKCKRCGKMFEIPVPESQKRYCPDCVRIIFKEHGEKRRKISDWYACELCGAEFFRGRHPNGMAKGGKMCPECYDKWVHMGRDQKHEFKNGERTLERLEAIRNGRKTHVCKDDN